MATQGQKELRKKLVEALRSGEYQQTENVLEKDGKFCCLGVACVVAGASRCVSGGLVWYGEDDNDSRITTLPPSVAKKYGFRTKGAEFGKTSLWMLNDTDRKTFAEIADIIEAEPEGLFKD